jgi:hypothetical protein
MRGKRAETQYRTVSVSVVIDVEFIYLFILAPKLGESKKNYWGKIYHI